eukprot:6486073-Amphidinium_carterae.1
MDMQNLAFCSSRSWAASWTHQWCDRKRLTQITQPTSLRELDLLMKGWLGIARMVPYGASFSLADVSIAISQIPTLAESGTTKTKVLGSSILVST